MHDFFNGLLDRNDINLNFEPVTAGGQNHAFDRGDVCVVAAPRNYDMVILN